MAQSTESSFDEAARAFRSLEREMEKVADKSIRDIGEEIMTDVKASRQGRGVPRDEGTLAASGNVKGPDAKGVVTLGFGGPAAPYALVQHERTDFSHDVGEARYLVRGVERWRADGSAAMLAMKANAMEAVLKSGNITSGGSFTSAPFT